MAFELMLDRPQVLELNWLNVNYTHEKNSLWIAGEFMELN